MKMIRYIFFILIGSCYSQSSFQNFGNIQMHENAEVGFHIDLVNNGAFNNNLGLAGFYSSDASLSISGSEIPRFFNVEVEVVNHLFLDINTEVINSVSYIAGDVITPRENPEIALDYLNDAFYILEDDEKNTDGYASYSGDLEFSFPIGDNDKLRPLIATNTNSSTIIKAAYFDENPNFPSTFLTNFTTTKVDLLLGKVSDLEFWDFDGPDNSLVTLTWDAESDITNIVEDIKDLRVVGWHIIDQEWKDLGNSGVTGTLFEGTINSFVFNPFDYEVLTFGALVKEEGLTIYNLVSPNNDGVNETFVIEGIEALNNNLTIYNRWGNKVYETTNYKNDWGGISNVNLVINRNKKLPAGTYYYVLKVKSKSISTAGWLYINY